jgi:hypothetical protein
MKHLTSILLLSIALASCSKEQVQHLPNDDKVRIAEPNFRAAPLPNELVWEDPDPTDKDPTEKATCVPNPVDCGPWIVVKGKAFAFAQFTNAMSNSDELQAYFSGPNWQNLFDEFDADILAGLQDGSIVITEVENPVDNARIFIVHYANQEANKANNLLALPFDTNE